MENYSIVLVLHALCLIIEIIKSVLGGWEDAI